jgi:ribosomal-protein-alanine N-acetyltransferase
MHEIKTARLVLTPMRPEDADELHRVWTHPAVRKFLWDDRVLDLEETREAIETSRRTFASRAFGLWAARLHPRRQMAGFGGFWCFRDQPEPEILYALSEDFRGVGLATEMAKAFITYGFDTLGYQVIRGSTDLHNTESVGVMERAGMRFERRAIVHGLDTLYYLIERSTSDRGESR